LKTGYLKRLSEEKKWEGMHKTYDIFGNQQKGKTVSRETRKWVKGKSIFQEVINETFPNTQRSQVPFKFNPNQTLKDQDKGSQKQQEKRGK
jgi:hypothetical protein